MKFKVILISYLLIRISIVSSQSDTIFRTSFEFVPQLNDTGITWSVDIFYNQYDYECQLDITSPYPQDCNDGRDFTHNNDADGQAGLIYTKLDAAGNELPIDALFWSCVRDNITELVWEVKSVELINSIHYYGTSYAWGGIGTQGSYGTIFNSDWDTLVNGSNNESFCGFSDWRVPSISEMESLINYGAVSPTIDVNFFPLTLSDEYWTSTPDASNPDIAWSIDFNTGKSKNNSFEFQNRNTPKRVRLVRSNN
jgi:hypothetical protein